MGNYFPRLWTKWETYNENFWENTGLFRKTMKSCFGIFWEIAGKKSHMGKNFLRLWTKRENYNGNFWENMRLFRKTMKSRFGIF